MKLAHDVGYVKTVLYSNTFYCILFPKSYPLTCFFMLYNVRKQFRGQSGKKRPASSAIKRKAFQPLFISLFLDSLLKGPGQPCLPNLSSDFPSPKFYPSLIIPEICPSPEFYPNFIIPENCPSPESYPYFKIPEIFLSLKSYLNFIHCIICTL